MSTVISNWYVLKTEQGPELNWWSHTSARSTPPPGASKGKDCHGKEGWFVGSKVRVTAYQNYDGGMLRFEGADGKSYIAALSTHYNNKKYPAQCLNYTELWEKLKDVKK